MKIITIISFVLFGIALLCLIVPSIYRGVKENKLNEMYAGHGAGLGEIYSMITKEVWKDYDKCENEHSNKEGSNCAISLDCSIPYDSSSCDYKYGKVEIYRNGVREIPEVYYQNDAIDSVSAPGEKNE